MTTLEFSLADEPVSTLVPDWKKVAAQAAGSSTEEIEKAFLDQAYGTIEAKCSPICKGPYRVGFEIVQKNDDNTRMVGIFIFRVSKELFYAPCFFTNGAINGTDLFYRHSAKRFVPLTNNWVEHLMAASQTGEGQAVPQSMRQQAHDQLHLERISQPPASMNAGGYRKWASFAKHEEDPQLAAAFFASFKDETIKSAAANPPGDDSILRRFLIEDGGWNARAKIANAAKANFAFANALFVASAPENYAPEIPDLTKQAAAEPILSIVTGLLRNPGVKSASADDLKRGYLFIDKRAAEETNDVVYTEDTKSLTSVTEPGMYDVMLSTGETHRMLCAFAEDMGLLFPRGAGYRQPMSTERGREFAVIDQSNNHSTYAGTHKNILGEFKEIIPEAIGEALPKSGKAYRIFNEKKKTLSEPFLVTKITDGDTGLKRIEIKSEYSEGERPLVANPDYDGVDLEEKIFGKCCRFIEVAHEKRKGKELGPDITFSRDISFGDKSALNAFIFDHGYPPSFSLRCPLFRLAGIYI